MSLISSTIPVTTHIPVSPCWRGRQRQVRGLTLIELMIGLVIGMIVLGAVIALFIAFNKSSFDLHRSIRLEQDVRAAVDFIARDLRRAGHVHGAQNRIGQAGFCDAGYFDCSVDPPAAIFEVDGSEIRYGYDSTGDGVVERYGFELVDGALLYTVGDDASGWPLHDPAAVRFTELVFEDDARFVALSGTAGINIREIKISVTAQVATDPAVTRTVVETVRIRNNEFVR